MTRSVGRRADAGGSYDGAGAITYGDGTGWKTFESKASHTPSAQAGLWAHRLVLGYHFDRYQTNSGTFDTTHWRNGTADAVDECV